MNIGQIATQMTGFPTLKVGEEKSTGSSNFSNMLQDTLQSMETTQVKSQNSIQRLLTTGEGNAHEVLIGMNKAESQIKTAAVVRDKLIENYQQIMNMQI